MIFAPPRHGKSEELSRLFSAYYLKCFPDRWVGINSYAAELAYTLSRSARDNFITNGGSVKDDAAAVKHWETTHGGGLWAAGVGGPITGKGFHLGIIDDPIKNAEEAASETIQKNHQAWYASTFYTREEPDGAIVIMMTRWNELDLCGWLLDQELEEEPERWHIVKFEAIKEEPYKGEELEFPATCTVERDDRQPGEALCSERYPLEKLHKIAKRIGTYFWNALYRQRPTAKEGYLFKVEQLEIVPAAPVEAVRVRYWDKGATDDGGDYTAGVRMGKAGDVFYVEHVERGQWSTDRRDKVIKQTAELDGGSVIIKGEQEPGASGKDAALAFIRMLAGFIVSCEPASGDKELRADPFSSQVNAGNVKLVKGGWNRDFIEELRAFPKGKHDDQVDAASGAFSALTKREPLEMYSL